MMKSFIWILAFCFIFESQVFADNSLPWIKPTSDPFHSKIEEGWNFLILGGVAISRGRSRDSFLGVEPWREGWISKVPLVEFGFYYAPHPDWEVGVQIPESILSSTFNTYYRLSDYMKFGAKLGCLSTVSLTGSLYPFKSWFISLTPSMSFNRFGFPPTKRVDESDLFVTPALQEYKQSRFTYNGQLAFGRHIDPVDLALLVNYAYAPGSHGIENSFVFDDTFMRHFLRFSLGVNF